MAHVEVCALLPSLTNGLNPVLGFALDAIFSANSAKRPIAVIGISTEIELVLNPRYQSLYNGITAAKFQVRSHSYIYYLLEH